MINSQKGFAMPLIIAMVGLALVIGGVFYFRSGEQYSDEDKMVKKDEAMVKDGESMMKKDVVVAMSALNASGQTGKATFSDMGGKTKVTVEISGSIAGVSQPSHIHMDEYSAPGAILYPLNAVTNGKAETVLDVSLEALGSKLPLTVMVHKSKDEAKIFVSGGNLPKDSFGAMMKKEDGAMMTKYTGTVLAGKTSPLLDYNKADYDTAVKSDKLVVLYFYANWCPICKKETQDSLYPVFNEFTDDKVVGIRINYKDSDTDNEEKALAQQFGIPYQHTKVFLRNGKQILKAPDSWNKGRYLSEINKAIGQ